MRFAAEPWRAGPRSRPPAERFTGRAMGVLGSLLSLTIWVAEVSQFLAVVGVAITTMAVIVWGCIGSERWKLRDVIQLVTLVTVAVVFLAAIGLVVLFSRAS